MGIRTLTIILVSILAGIIAACSSAKNKGEDKSFEVNLSFFTHKPYCGGAYPSPEQEKGYTSPMNNYEFALYKDPDKFSFHQESNKLIKTFKVDSNGEVHFNLPLGDYYVVFADKTLPFKAFYKKYNTGDGVYNTNSDESCFFQWYRTPEFRFTVIDKANQKHSRTFNETCFNGLNPCVNYIGPMPPSVGR